MKIVFFSFLFITGIQSFINARQIKELEKVITLVMADGDGRNGACVAYHPVQKKYYAGFAGNAQYPMAVFDIKGKRLSKDDLRVGFDLRGLWYNNITKTLQGNGYKDFGWTNFSLNERGIPTGNKIHVKQMSQPTEQSVGAFDDKKKLVYFLSGNKVIAYDLNGMQKDETKLIISEDSTEEADDYLPERYNSAALIFTGIDHAEWGLLNLESKEVILFDSATGKPTRKWAIASEADMPFSLGFAYANGIVFIFNKEEREWAGYK